MTLRPASAADPIIGTWKLDVGSSKFVVAPPKEQTEVYRETDSGEIEMRLTRLQSDGKSTSTTLMWPSSGGAVHDIDGHLPKEQTLVATSVGPGEWFVTYMRNGKQYLVMHKLISKDGKTMRRTIKGLDAHGHAEEIELLRRQ
jgi:hypothetical protein